MRKSKKICDYSGYSCQCDGYKKAGPGTAYCACGHSKGQHNASKPIEPKDEATLQQAEQEGMQFIQSLFGVDFSSKM